MSLEYYNTIWWTSFLHDTVFNKKSQNKATQTHTWGAKKKKSEKMKTRVVSSSLTLDDLFIATKRHWFVLLLLLILLVLIHCCCCYCFCILRLSLSLVLSVSLNDLLYRITDKNVKLQEFTVLTSNVSKWIDHCRLIIHLSLLWA